MKVALSLLALVCVHSALASSTNEPRTPPDSGIVAETPSTPVRRVTVATQLPPIPARLVQNLFAVNNVPNNPENIGNDPVQFTAAAEHPQTPQGHHMNIDMQPTTDLARTVFDTVEAAPAQAPVEQNNVAPAPAAQPQALQASAVANDAELEHYLMFDEQVEDEDEDDDEDEEDEDEDDQDNYVYDYDSDHTYAVEENENTYHDSRSTSASLDENHPESTANESEYVPSEQEEVSRTSNSDEESAFEGSTQEDRQTDQSELSHESDGEDENEEGERSSFTGASVYSEEANSTSQ